MHLRACQAGETLHLHEETLPTASCAHLTKPNKRQHPPPPSHGQTVTSSAPHLTRHIQGKVEQALTKMKSHCTYHQQKTRSTTRIIQEQASCRVDLDLHLHLTLTLTHREVSPELGPYHSVRAVSAAHLSPHHAVLGPVLERLRLKPSHHVMSHQASHSHTVQSFKGKNIGKGCCASVAFLSFPAIGRRRRDARLGCGVGEVSTSMAME